MKTYDELEVIMDTHPYLFEGLTPAREVKFRKWLPNNMHIYKAFVKFAKELKEARHRD